LPRESDTLVSPRVRAYGALMAAPSMRLIVPHFGERPSYFQLVVRSMASNPDVHWLMLTDQPVAGAPPNLTVRLCRFRDLSEQIQRHFDFDISLDTPYKLCDFRPAFGEIFARELRGYDFWGHSDLDVIFGRIRDHLPSEAFETDKVLFQGNFALYRNTAEAASWFRHEVGRVSYREVMSTPEARHFDEWAGIYYIVRDLDVSYWQEHVIFDLSFHMYRTRDEAAPGRDPRRYAWEDGEVCEYRLEKGQVRRHTALLVHLQKRTMRAPSAAVLQADRYWISPNRFTVQEQVTRRSVAAARVPAGREILPFYWRRLQRNIRRRRAATP
jgi:hypothetical protein